MLNIPTKETRDKLRNNILKYFSSEKEIWAYHPLTNSYLISNKGRIKNYNTNNILTTFPNRQGYYMVNVFLPEKGKRCYMIHRLVAETFYPFFHKDNIFEVNHINGNKSNNTIENLEWMTRQENLQHARDTGLVPKSNPKWKLSLNQVKEIKEFYNLGFSYKEIAKSYNISRNIIQRNLRRLYGPEI